MRKGFTLVELLAVIIILGFVGSIAVVSVNLSLKKSKETLSKTQLKKVEEAAEVYYLKEGMSTNVTCVSIDTLIDKGYIELSSVVDPKTKEELDGSVKIEYVANHYTYKYEKYSCE